MTILEMVMILFIFYWALRDPGRPVRDRQRWYRSRR